MGASEYARLTMLAGDDSKKDEPISRFDERQDILWSQKVNLKIRGVGQGLSLYFR